MSIPLPARDRLSSASREETGHAIVRGQGAGREARQPNAELSLKTSYRQMLGREEGEVNDYGTDNGHDLCNPLVHIR